MFTLLTVCLWLQQRPVFAVWEEHTNQWARRSLLSEGDGFAVGVFVVTIIHHYELVQSSRRSRAWVRHLQKPERLCRKYSWLYALRNQITPMSYSLTLLDFHIRLCHAVVSFLWWCGTVWSLIKLLLAGGRSWVPGFSMLCLFASHYKTCFSWAERTDTFLLLIFFGYGDRCCFLAVGNWCFLLSQCIKNIWSLI